MRDSSPLSPLLPHLKTEKERRQITTLPARNGGRELAKKYKVTWSSLFIVQHKYGKETATAVGIVFMMAVVGLSLPEAANPHAVKVMAEAGIDLSHHTPHSVEEYLGETWDYVITVCGGAREHCPHFTGRVGRRLHIGFDDPAGFVGTEAEVMEGFRRVRDEIRQRFHDLYEQELLTS